MTPGENVHHNQLTVQRTNVKFGIGLLVWELLRIDCYKQIGVRLPKFKMAAKMAEAVTSEPSQVLKQL